MNKAKIGLGEKKCSGSLLCVDVEAPSFFSLLRSGSRLRILADTATDSTFRGVYVELDEENGCS